MSEKKELEENNAVFYADDTDEPTIVWVRPPRRLRSFTRRVHFLRRLAIANQNAIASGRDESEADESEGDETFDEDTIV